jgi:UDP-2,3-diacylglucosamine hydrolase
MNEEIAAAVVDAGPLAIICGGGSLPFAVADAVIARRRQVVLFAIEGWADSRRIFAYRHHWIVLGRFGWFCRVARAEGCRDVVFIGALMRPAIRQVRLDLNTLRLLPRIVRLFRGGDDYLLSGIASIFEEQGFRLLGAHEVAPEILMPEGTLGREHPSRRDVADIEKGLMLLNATGPFDIGQAAVVADGRVIAVEAAEGTDQMLSRVAQLRRTRQVEQARGRGVLIKAAKRNQDRRLDLPSIGPQTIASAKCAGLAGIAVTAGSTIVADVGSVGAAADREKLFVIGVREPD